MTIDLEWAQRGFDEIIASRPDIEERMPQQVADLRAYLASQSKPSDGVEGDALAWFNTLVQPLVFNQDKIETIRYALQSAATLRDVKERSYYAGFQDAKNGTPCAEIRWQQEKETLQERVEGLCSAIQAMFRDLQHRMDHIGKISGYIEKDEYGDDAYVYPWGNSVHAGLIDALAECGKEPS